MSDQKNQDKKSLEVRNYQADFTEEDKSLLNEFRSQGLPGVSKVQATTLFGWFNLYMAGRSYRDIANSSGHSVELVLYHADRQQWCSKKIEQRDALINSVAEKSTAAKIEGLAFMYDLLKFVHERHSKDVVEYLTTKNEEAAARVDLKVVDRYVKIVDAINKIQGNPDDWGKMAASMQRPSVSINIGSAEIKRDANTIDIQANEGKSILKMLAEEKQKRESENK